MVDAQDSITDRGIKFEQGLSWRELLEKAKESNKYIFVDCYATWCVPCKYMADSILTKDEVETFMNETFLNVKVQMDQTTKDDDKFKSWYSEAKQIMDTYIVEAFPTFLFIDSDGVLVYKATGSFSDPAAFIAKASKATDPDEQYFFLLEEFNKGKREEVFINRLRRTAQQFGDENILKKLTNHKVK